MVEVVFVVVLVVSLTYVIFMKLFKFRKKQISDIHQSDDDLNIPVFSDESDFSLQETQDKLINALGTFGCCYYKMNKIDIKMYKSMEKGIFSYFNKTLNNKSLIKPLPKLRKYQSKAINYGYLDSYKKESQCRCFVIPFEENDDNINYMNLNNNPFRNNKNISIYVQSVIKHCKLFIHGIIYSYLNKNGFKDNNCNDDLSYLVGINPQKHLRINYYNPKVLKYKNHLNDKYGVKPHHDYGYVTFLAPSGPGLQIYYNNKWVDVPYFKDRFIVNIGKALQKTTNFQFKAAKHRVPLIETGKPRISNAFFYDPDINGNLMHYQSDGKLKTLKDFKTYFYGDMMTSYKNK